MRDERQFFAQIRRNYPENMSKEQFYKIAHVSKATARYLLDSGKIPCEKSGKMTHRYTIRTEDVIEYLKDRERHPEEYRVSVGQRYNQPGAREWARSFENELVGLTKMQREKLRKFFMEQLRDADDILSVSKASEVTGYNCSTIRRWCSTRGLESFRVSGDFYIHKQSLAQFLSGEYACGVKKKSVKHSKMISKFLREQNITCKNRKAID